MNYFEFLDYYNLAENNNSWDLFCSFRTIADVKGEKEAIKEFEL